MTGPSGANTQTSSVRCVIWHAAAGELPGELLTSLSKRVGRMLVCTDPYAAFAETCLIERECRDSGARVGPNRTTGILLLVQPRSLPMAGEIVEAAKLYAPAVSRWSFERGANPKLRAIVESEVAAWSLSAGAPVSVATTTRASAHTTEAAAPEGEMRPEDAPPPPPPRLAIMRRPVTTVQQGASVIAGPNISPRLRLAGIEHVAHDRTVSLPPTPAGGETAAPGADRQPRPRVLLTEQELRMLLSDDPIGGNGSNGDDHHGPVSPPSDKR